MERYAREILNELDRIVELGSIALAVPPEVEGIPKYDNISIVKAGRFHNRLWEHISFPWYVHKQKGISLNLCNVALFPAPGIVCIHDVKIRATPQYFSKKFLLWYSLLLLNATKREKKIVTVSKFSKSEIVKHFKVSPEKIVVIPNAWQHYEKIGYDENTLNKYSLSKGEYFFSMCSLEPNKNFKWIAEVERQTPQSVFAVAGSINEKVFAESLGFVCPENMILLGYVRDEEAKTLMRDCNAVATVKVGKGVKSEGELVISGTRGYIYIPVPWWKTDYFEVRYENTDDNKRYFYQLDGEGIRYELVAFLRAIETGKDRSYISREISDAMCKVIEDFYKKNDFIELN